MTPHLLATVAAFVAGWLLGRAVEHRAWMDACETPTPEREYDVQGPDPMTVHLRDGARFTTRGWGSMGSHTSRTGSHADTLEPLTPSDRDWLDQTVRTNLYPST